MGLCRGCVFCDVLAWLALQSPEAPRGSRGGHTLWKLCS
uniref:Uncharacterized protein n=1 Tax=Arundo donax TaxID=35708 RepID=A0A0A9T3Z3_ARUDO